ncbi:MAG: hypothetical protein U0166_27930 [Acidobacteriota bacterium]
MRPAMCPGVWRNAFARIAVAVALARMAVAGCQVDLVTLNGLDGFRLHGDQVGGEAGYSVSGAGDVNGDGIDDLLVGAWKRSSAGQGSAYVVFGQSPPRAASLDLASLDGTNGFVFNGAISSPFELCGASVAPAGDLNDDGRDDIVINAPGSSSVYVVFGRASFPAAMVPADLDGTNGFRMAATGLGSLGVNVASAGDVNDDGIDDVIVGAEGASNAAGVASGRGYVLFGRSTFPPVVDLSLLDGTDGFAMDGIAKDDNCGFSVAGAGDLNDDGIGDVILGAVFANAGSINEAGQAYVVFGRASGFPGSPDVLPRRFERVHLRGHCRGRRRWVECERGGGRQWGRDRRRRDRLVPGEQPARAVLRRLWNARHLLAKHERGAS